MLHEVYVQFVDEAALKGDEQAKQLLLPKKGSELAAGYDLVAANRNPIVLKPLDRALIPTGVAIALPPFLEAQVRPRSGLAIKHGVTVANAPGTIDADYRGEIQVILVNLGKEEFLVSRGMRIAQMVIQRVEQIGWKPVAVLPTSTRGESGFGSTGTWAKEV